MPFVYRTPRRSASDTETSTSSTTTTLADLWSAGTSTFDDDHSSRGSSMPWASEAIEQNRQDWLQIEEMLYGERELSKNEKIRKELQQWMNRFPHIRVRGMEVGIIDFGPTEHSHRYYTDEVIAIDPKPVNKYLKTFKPANKLTAKDNPIIQPAFNLVSNTSNLLEKCLRITSSSSWSKRPTIMSGAGRYPNQLDHDSDTSKRVKSVRSEIQCSSGFDIGSNQDTPFLRSTSSNIGTDVRQPNKKITLLGRLRRLPTVPPINLHSKASPWRTGRATDRSRITLPPITIRNSAPENESGQFQPFRSGRSMSAIHALP